ncbi:Long-chain-fatty-acid--[acyl-carrier-protein] ligase AEE15, chloroplastic [Galdieria sulphuraria]|nr:Long-chain-fatty-acid--[acyl-carrier-protein] ligase AEE15, chloroplastic [Galdieria sulphuraria]
MASATGNVRDSSLSESFAKEYSTGTNQFLLPQPIRETLKKWPSVPHMWKDLAEKEGNRVAIVDQHNGQATKLTFLELHRSIQACAVALKRIGLKKGNKVCLISENSYRWLVLDQAVMTIGAASAVRGSGAPLLELCYIYEHSESIGLVAENAQVLVRLVEKLGSEKLKFAIILWGKVPTDFPQLKIFSFDSLIQEGWNYQNEVSVPFASSSDLATLIYTSGTTGRPKGVELTHENLLYQIASIDIGKCCPVPGNVFVSILPCWHVFERTAEYFFFARGVCVVYSNVRNLRNDLQLHKPQFLVAVPRVFESLYNNIMSNISKQSLMRRYLIRMFTFISLSYHRAFRTLFSLDIFRIDSRFWKKLKAFFVLIALFTFHKLANWIVWSKIRSVLGGRVQCGICGGGSLPFYLEEFYASTGVCLLVGYGLTETSPVVSHRRPGLENMLGSSGRCLPGTQVKVVHPETKEELKHGDIGLLLVRGPGVVRGYYREPERSDVFLEDGFFNSGDLAWIVPNNGHIVISGRYKDVIVLNNGENIEPQPIEDAILESPLFDQVILVGQDERHLGALLVPSLEYLKVEGILSSEYITAIEEARLDPSKDSFLREEEVKLTKMERIKQLVRKELYERVVSRPHFTPNDFIRTFHLILAPFTVENGLLTQTLKVKRSEVYKRYKKEISSLFHYDSFSNPS